MEKEKEKKVKMYWLLAILMGYMVIESAVSFLHAPNSTDAIQGSLAAGVCYFYYMLARYGRIEI